MPANHYSRERKYRRFDLQFPVRVSFPSAGTVRELEATSRNVSMGGLLLRADDLLPSDTPVSLTIDVEGPKLKRRVRLVGEGHVVRVKREDPDNGFTIAIQCERPIAEVENLPSAAEVRANPYKGNALHC